MRCPRLLVLVLSSALLAGAGQPEGVLRHLPYAGVDDEARSLDLYLPAASRVRPPLVALVHSRLWSKADGLRAIDADFARPLQEQGVAVAVVRHRLAPAARHPEPAQDVAAAVEFLVRNAERYGYDPRRIFLAGHASGAHVAALVALDPRYLGERGLDASKLAGVIGISGVYDLDPEGGASPEEEALYDQVFGDTKARRDASPIRYARQDAPRFLILVAENDAPGYADAGERFAAALRRAGAADAEAYPVLRHDHLSILEMSDPVGASLYLLAFVGVRPLPPVLAEVDQATRYWRHPRLSSEPFWQTGARVRSFDADDRFVTRARGIFVGLEHKRATFAARRFHAVDLYELLDALGPERAGTGRWLTLTNALGQRTYLDLEQIRKWKPVIVIGVDDERNLFTLADIHRARREYSWRDDLPRPPYLARPMGAFLYFLKEPEQSPIGKVLTPFSLTVEAFRRSEEDPLAPLRDLDPELQRVLIHDNACVSCHSVRGVGPRSGHLRASDGEPQGGFALPLEEYPPDVWRRFVFEPAAAAEAIGTSMNPIQGPGAQLLFDLVERERARRAPGAGGPAAAEPPQ